MLEKCFVISQEKNKSDIHHFNANNFSSYDEIKLLIYLSILYKIESDEEKYNYYKQLSYELGKASEFDIDKIFKQIEKISISSDNIVYLPVIKDFILKTCFKKNYRKELNLADSLTLILLNSYFFNFDINLLNRILSSEFNVIF